MSDEAKHREIVRKAMKRARPELPKDPTDTQWGFADAREAFAHLSKGAHFGKVVIKVAS